MGSWTKEGDSPVNEIDRRLTVSGVAPNTRNLVWSRVDHHPSLNTTWWPIVKQYREGKVKRTPGGEWNRTWNPMFTSRQRALRLDVVLFVERSGEYMLLARLRCSALQPKGNRVWKARKVSDIWPETKWPIHGQVEAWVKSCGGPNRLLLKKKRMTCG